MAPLAWDEEQARANLSKHRSSFQQATDAFRDPFAVEFLDDRLVLIVQVAGPCLKVACAGDDERCRLISAWSWPRLCGKSPVW
jgi:uncharacterized DUF497 family protein